jgi:hypothetical protein
VTMTKVSVPRITTALKMTLMTEDEEEDITPDEKNTGRSNHLPNHSKLPSTSAKATLIDLADDEEHILMHDGLNILSDDEEDEEDMDDEDDNQSTPKWGLNLSERARYSSSLKSTTERLDKTYLF